MCTVGLGDLKPITNMGYIINTVTMYSGVILSSIAVMLLRNIFSLSSRNFLFDFRIEKDIGHNEILVRKTVTEGGCLRLHKRVTVAIMEEQEEQAVWDIVESFID